jgi:hypothetical protein
MSVELGKLGLEIGHEKSDALHDWAREVPSRTSTACAT